MITDYKISGEPEHYTCMVDLLGCAGHLQEAENMIKAMLYKSHVNPWMALLGTCRIHGNVEMGELNKFLNCSLRTGHLSILLRFNLMEKLFILMEEDICFNYVITCLQLERGLSSSTTAQFCLCLDLLCLMSMLWERCCTENNW
jgi:pentatricopeptide repeat protein